MWCIGQAAPFGGCMSIQQMRRRDFIAGLGGAAAWPVVGRAQQAKKAARIGFLGTTFPSVMSRRIEGLQAGLRDVGWVQGQNLFIEFRWAEGKYDRLPELAAELVRLKVDVLVTHSTPGTLAAKQATKTIPIVMAVSGDAVATGLVASLARPGGNITGSTFFGPELHGKRVELLKEALPRISQVAILLNADNPVSAPSFEAAERTARSLKVKVQKFEVRQAGEFDAAFAAMVKRRAEAVVTSEEGMIIANAKAIADLALKNRLPTISGIDLVDAGGLMGYAANQPELYRRAAVFIDKILKGAKPTDLPIEQATKFELTINLRTAKALGLAIPPTLLARADEVIE
jgi:putative tryptophan/tyrosine transport system substrate-binding protein